jgi:beta-lactam-binding protein with PASTA domain
MENTNQVPDVLGLTVEEGCLILQKYGYRISCSYTYYQDKYISRIIGQRVLDKEIVELVISDEYYNDPSDDPSI